ADVIINHLTFGKPCFWVKDFVQIRNRQANAIDFEFSLFSHIYSGFSRTTSFASLSSRIPRKTGCRNFPSRVHSAYLTWQTSLGLSQWQRFISDGVIPAP